MAVQDNRIQALAITKRGQDHYRDVNPRGGRR